MKLKITEGRNPKTGKPITIISDIKHNPQVIEDLASKIKSQCGAGGHVEGKKIIIQGSHSDKIQSILDKEGFEY
ncbi:MAG: translation initiation factor [Balneolaceae bacterium]